MKELDAILQALYDAGEVWQKIQRGVADFKAGRTRPWEEIERELFPHREELAPFHPANFPHLPIC